MSQQDRSIDALTAALTHAATADRAARNTNRLRRASMEPPKHPLNLAKVIEAVQLIDDITRHLAKLIDNYGDAVRYPAAGYSAARKGHHADSRQVTDAADRAQHALHALAKQLRSRPCDTTDAIAALEVAVITWQQRHHTQDRSTS